MSRTAGSDSVHRRAIRDFLVSVAALSVFTGVPLYFYETSSVVTEPWRSGILLGVTGAWTAAGIGLALNLRRDLTPATLGDDGLQVRGRFVPYAEIEIVDPQPGRMVFRLRLRNRKFDFHPSKIGVVSEEEYFQELKRRVEEARRSSDGTHDRARNET